MIYFKMLVLGFAALLMSSQAQAATNAKDKAVGRLILVKRKVALRFNECVETARTYTSYQCSITYKGSQPYESIVNPSQLSKQYDRTIRMNDTYSAVASLSVEPGQIFFQYYVAHASGARAYVGPHEDVLIDEENKKAILSTYESEVPQEVEFYVQTVR